jgi:hypothetical protein
VHRVFFVNRVVVNGKWRMVTGEMLVRIMSSGSNPGHHAAINDAALEFCDPPFTITKINYLLFTPDQGTIGLSITSRV